MLSLRESRLSKTEDTEIKKRLFEDLARITMTQIKQTLAELVQIDSVSSRSNAEIIEYLERRCAGDGFSYTTLSIPGRSSESRRST